MTNDRLRNGVGCVRHLSGLSAHETNGEANDCERFSCNPRNPHSLAPSMCPAPCTATTPPLMTHSDLGHSHFSRQEVTQQTSGRTGMKAGLTFWGKKKGCDLTNMESPGNIFQTEWNVWVKECYVSAAWRLSPSLLFLGWGGSGLLSAAFGFYLCFQVSSLEADDTGLS